MTTHEQIAAAINAAIVEIGQGSMPCHETLDQLRDALAALRALPTPEPAPTTMPRPSTGHPPAEYRCGICGGMVHFDGTAPNPNCWPHGKKSRLAGSLEDVVTDSIKSKDGA